MIRILGLIAAWALVGIANAEWYTAYVNTFDSLDGVTSPEPGCEPYLYDGGAWVDCAIMDVMMDPINGINIDPPIDFTYGELTVTLQWYSELWIPGEIVGFWVRLYSRAWDEDAEEWVFSGMQNYFYQVEQSGPGGGPGWQTWTRPVDDYDETDFLGPFYDDQVYKFRIDVCSWIAPYSFGISHFELVVPECPMDLDGDDDVDLNDLAMLLSEYGCAPAESTVYDTGGFEAYDLGALVGQDGWETLGFVGVADVVEDPTGGGMGKVVVLDAVDGTSELLAVQRLLDMPLTDGIIIYEWDQYRPDLGDNVWLCDDFNYDGWWAIQWDISDPHWTSPAYWASGAPLSLSVWERVRYEINLATHVATVQVNDGNIYSSTFTADDMKGIEFEIQDTEIEGNGPIYLDNVVIKRRYMCPIDYNADGYTDLTDLATLLSAYGCGAP